MLVVKFLGKRDIQTDMDGPIRCSLLTLEREEYLKTENNKDKDTNKNLNNNNKKKNKKIGQFLLRNFVMHNA
jgi:hypothetical protein